MEAESAKHISAPTDPPIYQLISQPTNPPTYIPTYLPNRSYGDYSQEEYAEASHYRADHKITDYFLVRIEWRKVSRPRVNF